MAVSVARPHALLVPRSQALLRSFGDERLVEQLRRGNEAAFEAIYSRHSPALLSFCRHMLGSREEAEDALQHVFTAAHRELTGGDREINLKPWLFTIARNRCLSVLRARREHASELIEPATVGLAEQVQHRSDLRDLLSDISRLPDDQRAALVLAELGDLSHAEIAIVVGCEAGKVKALVYQARQALADRRSARETPCTEIREQLAIARGGALRRGQLRRHLNQCPACSEFRDEVRRQRAAFSLILPVAPTAALKASVLAAAGGGAAGGAAGGGGALVAGGLSSGGTGAALGLGAGTTKLAAILVAASATGVGGTVLAVESEQSGGRERTSSPSAVAAPESRPGERIPFFDSTPPARQPILAPPAPGLDRDSEGEERSRSRRRADAEERAAPRQAAPGKARRNRSRQPAKATPQQVSKKQSGSGQRSENRGEQKPRSSPRKRPRPRVKPQPVPAVTPAPKPVPVPRPEARSRQDSGLLEQQPAAN